jgi:dienelactone hydrolase
MTAAAVDVAVAAAGGLPLGPAPLQLALQQAAVEGPRVVHLQVIQQMSVSFSGNSTIHYYNPPHPCSTIRQL